MIGGKKMGTLIEELLANSENRSYIEKLRSEICGDFIAPRENIDGKYFHELRYGEFLLAESSDMTLLIEYARNVRNLKDHEYDICIKHGEIAPFYELSFIYDELLLTNRDAHIVNKDFEMYIDSLIDAFDILDDLRYYVKKSERYDIEGVKNLINSAIDTEDNRYCRLKKKFFICHEVNHMNIDDYIKACTRIKLALSNDFIICDKIYDE